ncbi:MAG: hypothetical protein AAGC77_05345 [Pseudomonadota bacterium]
MANEDRLEDVIDALKQVLDSEKALLLNGDYQHLADISKQKERLCSILDRLMVAPANLKKISLYRKALSSLGIQAKENEKLLMSAKTGMARAHGRVKDIINRQRNVGVYGASGDKLMTPGAGVSRSKMA